MTTTITKKDFLSLGLVTTSEPIQLNPVRYYVELESDEFSIELEDLLYMIRKQGGFSVELQFDPPVAYRSQCRPESLRIAWRE